MEVTKVSIRKIENSNPRMKGTAYVELDNAFAIEHIRIIERADGSIFAAMPSQKTASGEFRDTCHPINKETRDMLNKAIIDEYNKVKDENPEA